MPRRSHRRPLQLSISAEMDVRQFIVLGALCLLPRSTGITISPLSYYNTGGHRQGAAGRGTATYVSGSDADGAVRDTYPRRDSGTAYTSSAGSPGPCGRGYEGAYYPSYRPGDHNYGTSSGDHNYGTSSGGRYDTDGGGRYYGNEVDRDPYPPLSPSFYPGYYPPGGSRYAPDDCGYHVTEYPPSRGVSGGGYGRPAARYPGRQDGGWYPGRQDGGWYPGQDGGWRGGDDNGVRRGRPPHHRPDYTDENCGGEPSVLNTGAHLGGCGSRPPNRGSHVGQPQDDSRAAHHPWRPDDPCRMIHEGTLYPCDYFKKKDGGSGSNHEPHPQAGKRDYNPSFLTPTPGSSGSDRGPHPHAGKHDYYPSFLTPAPSGSGSNHPGESGQRDWELPPAERVWDTGYYMRPGGEPAGAGLFPGHSYSSRHWSDGRYPGHMEHHNTRLL